MEKVGIEATNNEIAPETTDQKPQLDRVASMKRFYVALRRNLLRVGIVSVAIFVAATAFPLRWLHLLLCAIATTIVMKPISVKAEKSWAFARFILLTPILYFVFVDRGRYLWEAVILTSTVVGILTFSVFWATKKGYNNLIIKSLDWLVPVSFLMIIFSLPGEMLSWKKMYSLMAVFFSGCIIECTDKLIKSDSYDKYASTEAELYHLIILLLCSVSNTWRG